MKDTFTITVEKTATGYSAYCEPVDNCFAATTGKDIEALLINLIEAIELVNQPL